MWVRVLGKIILKVTDDKFILPLQPIKYLGVEA